jgi:hypothetical protein
VMRCSGRRKSSTPLHFSVPKVKGSNIAFASYS